MDQDEEGKWYIQYLYKDPEVVKRQKALSKKERMNEDDDQRMQRLIRRQQARARKAEGLPEEEEEEDEDEDDGEEEEEEEEEEGGEGGEGDGLPLRGDDVGDDSDDSKDDAKADWENEEEDDERLRERMAREVHSAIERMGNIGEGEGQVEEGEGEEGEGEHRKGKEEETAAGEKESASCDGNAEEHSKEIKQNVTHKLPTSRKSVTAKKRMLLSAEERPQIKISLASRPLPSLHPPPLSSATSIAHPHGPPPPSASTVTHSDPSLSHSIGSGDVSSLPPSSSHAPLPSSHLDATLSSSPSSSSFSSTSISGNTVSLKRKRDESESDQKKPRKLSAVEEIRLQIERKKEMERKMEAEKKKHIEPPPARDIVTQKRVDHWVAPGIIVKIMHSTLAGGKYYRMKAEILSVVDKYGAIVRVIDNGHKLQLDQEDLETVLPSIGGVVRIVNGTHRGECGRLISVDVERFCGRVQLTSGPSMGREFDFEYEDICKMAE